VLFRSEEFSYDTVAQQGVAAQQIADMMRDPAQIRNAFIFGELMRRPDFGSRRR